MRVIGTGLLGIVILLELKFLDCSRRLPWKSGLMFSDVVPEEGMSLNDGVDFSSIAISLAGPIVKCSRSIKVLKDKFCKFPLISSVGGDCDEYHQTYFMENI